MVLEQTHRTGFEGWIAVHLNHLFLPLRLLLFQEKYNADLFFSFLFVFCCCLFVFWPCNLWDLSSLTRDWTQGLRQWELRVLTTRPPGNSCWSLLIFSIFPINELISSRRFEDCTDDDSKILSPALTILRGYRFTYPAAFQVHECFKLNKFWPEFIIFSPHPIFPYYPLSQQTWSCSWFLIASAFQIHLGIKSYLFFPINTSENTIFSILTATTLIHPINPPTILACSNAMTLSLPSLVLIFLPANPFCMLQPEWSFWPANLIIILLKTPQSFPRCF